jgi:5'-nucleotidase
MKPVKYVAPLFAVLLAAAVGCANNKKGVSENRSVTEITPPSASSYNPPIVPIQTVASAPVASTPSYEPAITPAMSVSSTPSAASTGGSYVVKKGDTLYSIARSHYGDGKQYKKIVAANPGVSARNLKAGQTLTLP